MRVKKAAALLFAALMIITLGGCAIKNKGDKLAETGAAAYTAGNYETALENLKAAEAAGLSEYSIVDLKAFLGSTYLKLGDTDNAILYYKQVTDSRSFEMTPWLNLGVAQKTAGLYDEALESYKKAEQFDNGGKEAALLYLSMGNLYIEENRPLDAIDVLIKATERNPDFADAYAYLAIAYAQMLDFDNADMNYNKAAELGYGQLGLIKEQIDKFR
ncbi:MAG: tetratricopeptide repeat protein [Ruminococcus sp.]|jgi:tetratricopeptide (TPR) repeat protein|nr:tetratricopeptide repeat protein [Ruminococcus sp.]